MFLQTQSHKTQELDSEVEHLTELNTPCWWQIPSVCLCAVRQTSANSRTSSHSGVLSHRYLTGSTGNLMQQILFSASAHELWPLGGVRNQNRLVAHLATIHQFN